MQKQQLNDYNVSKSNTIERKIGKINPANIQKLRDAIVKLQDKFSIKVTMPEQKQNREERFLFII